MNFAQKKFRNFIIAKTTTMNSYLTTTKQKQIKISQIRDLVSIAYIDGEFHPKELEIIQKIGLKLGLITHEIETVISNPEKIQFQPSIDKNDKKEHLIHLIEVIFADDQVKEEEIELYDLISHALGFTPSFSKELLAIHLEESKNNNSIFSNL